MTVTRLGQDRFHVEGGDRDPGGSPQHQSHGPHQRCSKKSSPEATTGQPHQKDRKGLRYRGCIHQHSPQKPTKWVYVKREIYFKELSDARD